MAALHLVGIDFQAGHGVGLTGVAQQQIAAFLIGIRAVRAFVHFDETGENGARSVEENVFI